MSRNADCLLDKISEHSGIASLCKHCLKSCLHSLSQSEHHVQNGYPKGLSQNTVHKDKH